MQDEFRAVMRETVAEGRTVFLSSHSLDEVQRVADRVGIIRDGEMVMVDRVEHLLGQALRKVEIRFAEPVDPSPFAALPGVSDLRVDDGVLRFSVARGMDAVIKLAAAHPVIDLVSEAADLDEIFLALYRDGEGSKAGGAP
jgi:ABC-2 type transport system ATP-binding protein